MVCPGRQNWPAGLVLTPVCPISQTKEFGVSSTMPQPSALPICWVLNAGSIGPYLLFRTIVPDSPVVTSSTSMFHPCPGAPRWKWILIVLPALMTSGFLLEPLNSSSLNAAFSLFPVVVTCQVGEHTENLFGVNVTLKPPSVEQDLTTPS